MKKFLNLVFIGVVGFGFAGCGSEENKEFKSKEHEAKYKQSFKNDVDMSAARSPYSNPNEKK